MVDDPHGLGLTAAELRLLSSDARADDLLPLELDPTSIQSGTPRAGTKVLQDISRGEVGIWELTTGCVTDTEETEVFIVLSGRGQLTYEDGSATPLAPGTVVQLFSGDRTTWEITETLRKIYIS